MTADPEPKVSPASAEATAGRPDSAEATAKKPPASRWDTFLWPRWLPIKLRLPLVAQITGAVALTALITGPWWARIPQPQPVPQSIVAPRPPAVPLPAGVPQVPSRRETPAPVRPAHLNLDVRHSFNNADLSVSVDGKSALETRIEGSGKRFKVFGKRAERSFTSTLDLAPGVRVVRVRLRSVEDKFDQTRVERFELESATVAGLQVSADRSGLTLVAVRPQDPPANRAASTAATPAPAPAPAVAIPLPANPPANVPTSSAAARQEASAAADTLQSVRSMLIAIAGFVASTATAFVIQEFLRSRKALIFEEDDDRPRRGRGAHSV